MLFIKNSILHLANYFGVLMKLAHHIIMGRMLVFILVMELIILINVYLHNTHNKILANQKVTHFINIILILIF